MDRLIAVLAAIGLIAAVLTAAPAQAAQAPGTWANVTPANANITSNLDCGNFGSQIVVADPLRPATFYTEYNCQGIWRSTDYGQTWQGPINTGTNGVASGNGALGGMAIAPNVAGSPILYRANIRGGAQGGVGFWKSTDGGVNWTHPTLPANACTGGQDYGSVQADPYDPQHVIMTGHECSRLLQSFDGGSTWANVSLNGGMNVGGGSNNIAFIDTGNAATTRGTWLWTAQGTGGSYGTWRTTNAGASWAKVDNNEKPHGTMQIYQPDTSGVVYMAGIYSALGWGVLRSTNYGATWQHVGASGNEAIVFGTPNNVYAMYGWACQFCDVDPNYQRAPQPGATGWTSPGRPAGMRAGPGGAATAFDGTNWVIVTANWTAGTFRYVEPAGSGPPPATNTPTPVGPTATPAPPTATPPPTQTPVPGAFALRLNSGDGTYTDAAGNAWAADSGYSGSSSYTGQGTITGTADPTLYITERYGPTFSYNLTVPNGTYTLTLRFAELFWTAAGQRVFNVTVNGSPVLTNFDIFAQAGAKNKALDRSFPVTVSNGALSIAFARTVDNGEVTGIELVSAGAPPAATPTSAPTSTPVPPTNTPVPTATSVPPTDTPVPSATPTDTPVPPTATATSTPAPVCQVQAILNGTPTLFSRPASFCTDQ